MILALLALALTAEPSLLKLGTEARAVLRVSAAGLPALSASVGRVDGLHQVSEGVFEAEYIPPDDAVPQVAIVSAIAGSEVAWVAVPLWGQGDAVVKTRPGARIRVAIGDQIFGPVTADASGEAIVPVVVPPGVKEAHHGERAIDLHAPVTRTVHVAAALARIAVDVAQRVPVYLFAVDAGGAPRSSARLRLRTDRGSLEPLLERAAGLYETTLVLPPGVPGQARIEAWLEEEPALVATAAVELFAGPARQLELVSVAPVSASFEKPLSAVPPRSLSPLQAVAVSPKLGALSNFSGFNAPLIGVEGALRSDRLGPQLAVALEADYAFWSRMEPLQVGTSQVIGRSRIDLLLLHASLAFRFAAGDRNTAWISAGPSAEAMWTRLALGNGPSDRGFAVVPGLQAAVGAERRMGFAVPFLEMRASWFTRPGLASVGGPLRSISLVAGVRLEML